MAQAPAMIHSSVRAGIGACQAGMGVGDAGVGEAN